MEPQAERRREAWGDLATAAVLLAASAVGYWSIATDPNMTDIDYGTDPGPGFLPRNLIVLLAGCALALGGFASRRLIAAGRGDGGVGGRDWRALAMPGLFVATLLAFVFAATPVGFLAATAAFAVLWVVLLGVREEGGFDVRSLFLYGMQVAGIVIAVYLLFVVLIGVPLP